MSISKEAIKSAVFNYSESLAWDFDLLDIIIDTIQRIDSEENLPIPSDYDTIEQELDSCIIWESQKWAILKHYSEPERANYERALFEFETDISIVIDKINEELKKTIQEEGKE